MGVMVWIAFVLCVHHVTGQDNGSGDAVSASSEIRYFPPNGRVKPFFCESTSQDYHWTINGSIVSSDEMENREDISYLDKHKMIMFLSCVNNTQYGCRCNDNDKEINPSVTVYCKGAPEQVPDITVDYTDNNGNVTAALSWEEPFNNFDPITNYTVTCKSDDDSPCSGCVVNGNTTRQCHISGLAPTKNYTFSIKASNNIGIGEPGVKWCIAVVTGGEVSITSKILYLPPDGDDHPFPCKSTSQDYHWTINGSIVSSDEMKNREGIKYFVTEKMIVFQSCVNNTQYGCSYNDDKEINPSVTVYCKGAPEKVPGIHVDVKNNAISWGEPFNNFDSITNYTVTCKSDDDSPCSGCVVIGNTTRQCLISGLVPTKNYTIYVKANNSIGIGEPGVFHICAVRPPEIQDMGPVRVDLENNATFTCNATGDKVSYKWKNGSGSFDYSRVSGINTTTLVITNLSSSDNNSYTCVASNEGGNASSNVTLIVTGLPSVNVTLVTHNKKIAMFRASVSGVGIEAFTYKWKHGEKVIPTATTSTLNITNPNKEDEGEYVCTVSNTHRDKTESAPVTLTVKVPPEIQNMGPVNVTLEGNATLTCKATGDNISYEWKNGSGSFDKSRVSGTDTTTLVITSVRSSDNNKYTCVASNEGESVSSDVKLTITGLPSVTIELVTDNEKNIDTFKATVHGVGSDEFHYKWTHDGKDINEKTGTVRITNPKKDDEGKYVCIVSNKYGDESMSNAVTLTVTSDEDDNTSGGGFIGSNVFFLLIIIAIIVVPTVYVCHQNRAKISNLCGKKGQYRPYQLLPTSVGEALSRHND